MREVIYNDTGSGGGRADGWQDNEDDQGTEFSQEEYNQERFEEIKARTMFQVRLGGRERAGGGGSPGGSKVPAKRKKKERAWEG